MISSVKGGKEKVSHLSSMDDGPTHSIRMIIGSRITTSVALLCPKLKFLKLAQVMGFCIFLLREF